MDERIVDECKQECEVVYTHDLTELDEDDLVLKPISVSEHCDVCVLLSKVHATILLQHPH